MLKNLHIQQVLNPFSFQSLNFTSLDRSLSTIALDGLLTNLNIKTVARLKIECLKNDADLNIVYLNHMRALIVAIHVYFSERKVPFDASTGALMDLTKMQARREAAILNAVVIYDQYLASLALTK